MSGKILVGEKLNSSIEETNLGYFFFKSAEKNGPKICQIDGTIDRSETYASVKLRSVRVAIEMQKRGITSKDVITFCSSNTLDNVIPMLATFYLGGKVANLESSLSVRHTRHLLSLVTPKMIFVEESALSLIEESLEDANFPIEVVVFGQSAKYTKFSDLVKSQKNEENFRPVDADPDDVAIMFFSSGTTGLPKAICHSHKSYIFMINQNYQVGMCNALLHFTTFYWMTAMFMLTASFKSGGYRVFGRNPSSEDIFKIIEKYKVENIFMAPILTYPLTKYNNTGNYDISSVKTIMVGGTPIPSLQLEKLINLFQNTKIVNVYGMSEVGLIASFNFKTDKEFIYQKIGSSGRVAAEVHLKVVNTDTNELLGPNQKGEICISSPSMMKGYYKTDSSREFDNEGFLKTGDVGYYDSDGCVYVISRIKEMFKYQSWHIIPSSIEAVLLEHPAVKEAIVFGIPHNEDGEIPAACIVLNKNKNVSKDEIDKFLAGRVADREKLRGGITFVETLPKTPTGKHIRSEIRDFVIKSLQ